MPGMAAIKKKKKYSKKETPRTLMHMLWQHSIQARVVTCKPSYHGIPCRKLLFTGHVFASYISNDAKSRQGAHQ